MSLRELQDYTFTAKYASYLPEKKRRETWHEANDCVLQMHKKRLPEIADELEWAFGLAKQKRAIGSQRTLQFAGPAIEQHNVRGYNCCASYIDRPRVFQEIMYALLCGCGVGFSVQKHHIAKLPDLINYKPTETKEFTIPDSIEGWADAIGILVCSYFANSHYSEWTGKRIRFRYNKIRPKGSPFSHGCGKAPGPDGLRNAIEKIRGLLDRVIDAGQKRLKPIDAYDIIMHSSDAVLSGGIRRSATICIFSHDDEEMMNAKTGNWFNENPQRGRSNNSAALLRNNTSFAEFNKLVEASRSFGEPGFLWVDNLESLYNPCVEANFFAYNDLGESGFQFCNLSSINGKKCNTKELFFEAVKAATIIGTAQAAYTNFPYLGSVTEQITRREALLGVSITGIMDNPEILLDPKIQQEAAQLAVKVNEEIAKKIGINSSARITLLKPEGSSSCVLGSASGIHPHHAKRYIRRVQANKMEAPAQLFVRENPMAAEESVWSANNTDIVLNFCIEVPDGAKTKNDLSAIEFLENVKSTQQNWVAYGRVAERCTQPWLTHNVSNTVNVKPDEWEDVSRFIYDNRQYFSGISLLPFSGDKDYPQAPFVKVLNEKEIIREYGEPSLFGSGLIELALSAFNKNLWAACDSLFNKPEKLTKTQEVWIEKANRFAEKYMNGDVKTLNYMLKDIYLWKYWLDLKRTYKPVDYRSLQEDDDQTSPQENIACGGGACEII